MTRRQRREVFNRQVKRALSGDLHSAELALRLDAQSQPEDEQQRVEIKIVIVPDDPRDSGVTLEQTPAELPPGREQRLLAAPEGDTPASIEIEQEQPQGYYEERQAAASQPRPVRSYEGMTFDDLSDEEIAAFAADGWRSAPDHVRPKGSQIPSTRPDAVPRRHSLIAGLERYAGPYRGDDEPGSNDGHGHSPSGWDMSNNKGPSY